MTKQLTATIYVRDAQQITVTTAWDDSHAHTDEERHALLVEAETRHNAAVMAAAQSLGGIVHDVFDGLAKRRVWVA